MKPRIAQQRKQIVGAICLIVAAALFLLLPYLLPQTEASKRQERIENAAWQIHVIDVGQGDAMLLRCDAGDVLIDTGTNESEDALRAYLDKQGVKTLEYVFISHPHEDHMGGVDMILREYNVTHLIMSDLAPDADVGETFSDAVLSSHVNVIVPAVGDVFLLGELSFTVLSPRAEGFDTANDNSLVLRCALGDTSLLATGDAEAEVEAWLLQNVESDLLDCDLLKAGHHGSDSSSTSDFLEAVSPRYVAISCGVGNTYNHPVQGVLDAIARVDAQSCRTDTNGSLLFLSDGVTLWWEK